MRRILATLAAVLLPVALCPASAGAEGAQERLARTRAVVEQAIGHLATATSRAAAADQRVVAAQAQLDSLLQQQAARGAEEAAVADRLRAARAQVRAMAIAGYVQGSGGLRSIYDLVFAPDVGDLLHRSTLYDTAGIVTETGLAQLGEARAAASVVVAAAVAETERQRDQLAAATRDQLDAGGAIAAAEAALAEAQAALVAARGPAVVPGTDMTGTLLDAYRGGAALATTGDPACAIGWWVVAGVGKIESRHARGGRGMRADGTTTGIIGIALDGADGVALVADSDGGQLDGDADGDRAVGPMQFLPSTWKRWGVDANGDGRADPANVFDAAAGAARYLCATRKGATLDAPEGLRGALLSYNRSEAYVDVVTEAAVGYRDAPIPAWAFDPSSPRP